MRQHWPFDRRQFLCKNFLADQLTRLIPLFKFFSPALLSGLAGCPQGIFTFVTMLLDEDVDMNVRGFGRLWSTVSFISSHPRLTTWAKHPPRCRQER